MTGERQSASLMTSPVGFGERERRYLESLPAVREVRNGRIYYTKAFREQCVRRYMDGESPTALFREAGLDPRLIGSKRIERALARWRQASASTDGSSARPARKAAPVAGASDGCLGDARDHLIASQALRIKELEEQLDQIRQAIQPQLRSAGQSESDGSVMQA